MNPGRSGKIQGKVRALLLCLRGGSFTPPWVWGLYRVLLAPLLWLNHWRWRLTKRPERGCKLHLGCGPIYLPGWLNVDWLPVWKIDAWLDAQRGLPFADGGCAAIYSKELLEHLPAKKIVWLLRECHRVLKAGGILRLVVPGLAQTLAVYQAGDAAAFASLPAAKSGAPLAAAAGDFLLCDGHHRVLLDAEFLETLLRASGTWSAVHVLSTGQRGILSPEEWMVSEGRHGEMGRLFLVMEAVKP